MQTENNNKITLIIPDLHLRWQQADKIIKAAGADDVIFLGDFFDDFGDNPQSINQMIDWLETIINKPNYTFIYGNHDVHYAFPHEHLRCAGYAQWKHFIIRDRLDKKFWEHFKFYHFLDDKWLLTHAGLHKFNVPKKVAELHTDRPAFIQAISEYLDAEQMKAFQEGNWMLHAGHSRGGMQRVGGIDWCDFEREFYPVLGLNQIVGHTPQRLGFPKWCVLHKDKVEYYPQSMWTPSQAILNDVNASVNIDLDVWGNTHWGIWNGKKLTVLNYKDNL